MQYSKEETQHINKEQFHFLTVDIRGHVLDIMLNRPEKKNALHPVTLKELAFVVSHAQHNDDIWLVTLRARGDVFCAGADLKAMAGMGETITSTLPEPQGEMLLGELFSNLHKPCIAVVEGHVYAGGFLLLAGCTYVMACDDVKLGLPETKRGLFPFQVMESLCQVMPKRKVLDWCIRGYNLDVKKAYEWGLVTHLSQKENIKPDVAKLEGEILENSPIAIRMGMQAYAHLQRDQRESYHAYLRGMLMQTLQTKDAQEGIAAFRQKRNPIWTNQ